MFPSLLLSVKAAAALHWYCWTFHVLHTEGGNKVAAWMANHNKHIIYEMSEDD